MNKFTIKEGDIVVRYASEELLKEGVDYNIKKGHKVIDICMLDVLYRKSDLNKNEGDNDE